MTGPEWAHDRTCLSKKEGVSTLIAHAAASTARLVILSVAGVRCRKAVVSYFRMGNGSCVTSAEHGIRRNAKFTSQLNGP